jgi:hypothetical protein
LAGGVEDIALPRRLDDGDDDAAGAARLHARDAARVTAPVRDAIGRSNIHARATARLEV